MCPHCGKYSLCTCSNCKQKRETGERDTPPDYKEDILLDSDKGRFQCPYCLKEYMYYDAEDASWASYVRTDKYQAYQRDKNDKEVRQAQS